MSTSTVSGTPTEQSESQVSTTQLSNQKKNKRRHLVVKENMPKLLSSILKYAALARYTADSRKRPPEPREILCFLGDG